jgi:hypothetical protein
MDIREMGWCAREKKEGGRREGGGRERRTRTRRTRRRVKYLDL